MQISNCALCNLKLFRPCHLLVVFVTYLSGREVEIRKVVGYVIKLSRDYLFIRTLIWVLCRLILVGVSSFTNTLNSV